MSISGGCNYSLMQKFARLNKACTRLLAFLCLFNNFLATCVTKLSCRTLFDVGLGKEPRKSNWSW